MNYPHDLQLLLDSNEWNAAEKFINSMENNSSLEIKECLAWCYSRQEKYNEAIAIYDELLLEQPNNARWLYSKGYQYYAQKDYVIAVQYFEKALEIYPQFFKVKYRIAYALIQLSGAEKQWTKDVFWKAIRHLKDAHDIYKGYSEEEQGKNKSTYADICFLHGKTLVNSPKYIDIAIEMFEKALFLKKDIDTQYQLSKAYYNKGEYQKALNNLPQEVRPPYYVLELKSQIYTDMGMIDEANRVLFSILKFRKKDYLYQRLANNFLIKEQNEEALKYALCALKSNNKNYKNYLLCGQVYFKIKRYNEANDYLRTAREKRKKEFGLDLPEAVEIMDKISQMPQEVVSEVKNNEKEIVIGKILSYNNARGFGFILVEGDSNKYFFHISQVQSVNRQPIEGDMVCFNVETTKKGMQAINISYK